MERVEITQGDLLDALREALQQAESVDQHALTGPELQEALGLSDEKVRGLLKRLIARGAVEMVKTVRIDIAGRPLRVPGYRVKN